MFSVFQVNTLFLYTIKQYKLIYKLLCTLYSATSCGMDRNTYFIDKVPFTL